VPNWLRGWSCATDSLRVCRTYSSNISRVSQIWCCLRRRGNTVRKEVAALASPLYALQSIHHRPSSRSGRGTGAGSTVVPTESSQPQQQQQQQLQQQQQHHHQPVCPFPVPVCTRVQPETTAIPTYDQCLSADSSSVSLVCGAWSADGPSTGSQSDTQPVKPCDIVVSPSQRSGKVDVTYTVYLSNCYDDIVAHNVLCAGFSRLYTLFIYIRAACIGARHCTCVHWRLNRLKDIFSNS
jgi:hypothetical protein